MVLPFQPRLLRAPPALRYGPPDAHVARFQPLSKNDFIHWNVADKPLMADLIEAGANVAFQDPLCVPMSTQYDEALRDGISTRPLLTEPIGVRVSCGFRDGVQR